VSETVDTVKAIPAEVAKWWKDGHTRTEYLYAWEDGVVGHAGSDPLFWHEDTTSIGSYQDYKRGVLLGRVSDVLIAFMLAAIIFAIIAAF
jgi:hypothetical protein